MNRLLLLAVSQRFLVLLFVAIVAAIGLYCLRSLPVDAVPDVTNNQVQVLTTAPALAPLEVERQITIPVETAASGLPGVDEIRSTTKFGLSAVTIVFDDSVDTYFARQLVNERLGEARDEIPSTAGMPRLGPVSTGLGEIYQYELRAAPGSGGAAPRFDATSLRTVQDWIVRRQLLGVEGVAEVNSFGGLEKRFEVRLDPAKLQSFDVRLRDVVEALERNNANAGGAFVERGEEQYLVRGLGLVETADDVANVVVATRAEGVPIYVRDLGVVVEGAIVRQGAVTADGEGEIVAGIVMMLKGENARAVVDRVTARVAEIEATLPEGVELIPFYDRSSIVDRTVWTVTKNLAEGALIVVVVLVLLLGNWRGALVAAAVIPLSMLVAAIFMRLFGISGNLMSLGAIDFGLVVDGAVIMTENAVRRSVERQRSLGRQLSSEELRVTVFDASAEVRRATMFGELIIMIVYLPLLSLRGIEGRMFAPMALTVVFALLGSLVLSLTFVPAALTLVLRGKISERDIGLIGLARRAYRSALDATLLRANRALAVALLLLVASAGLAPFLGAEFLPRLDEGAIAIEARLLPSVSLDYAIESFTEVERVLRAFPEVTRVVTKIGRAEIATDPMSVNSGDVHVELRPRSEWTTATDREGLVERMSEAVARRVPGVGMSFSQPIELRVSELVAGVRSDVAIKLFGDDLDVLADRAATIGRVVREIDGAEDVKVDAVSGLPQLVIKPDRAAIARYGLNVEDVNDLVESLVAGKPAGYVYEGERRFDLVVRTVAASEPDVEAIKSMLLTSPSGARVPLGTVAAVDVVEGVAQVGREDARRRVAVECNVRGRDIAGFVAEARTAIARSVELPPGYYVRWGGQFESLERAAATLTLVVPLALALIFALLFASFGSARQALTVFTGVPFAAIGGVVALALRGMPLSISAGVGFIALSGVAVLNGLVMVGAINALRDEGRSIDEAVREGAAGRLRPVLMTALVASLGFVPMAIATSAGAEVQRPLATVVIGGLVTSTLLTLLLLPAIYRIAEGRAASASTRR